MRDIPGDRGGGVRGIYQGTEGEGYEGYTRGQRRRGTRDISSFPLSFWNSEQSVHC